MLHGRAPDDFAHGCGELVRIKRGALGYGLHCGLVVAFAHKGLLKLLKALRLLIGNGAPDIGHGSLAAARIAGPGRTQPFGKLRRFTVQKIKKIAKAARARRHLILAVGSSAVAVVAHGGNAVAARLELGGKFAHFKVIRTGFMPRLTRFALPLRAGMHKIRDVEAAHLVAQGACHGPQVAGRAHAAGQIQGGAAAAHTLHKTLNCLRLAHIRLGLVENLGAHEVAGSTPGQHHAVSPRRLSAHLAACLAAYWAACKVDGHAGTDRGLHALALRCLLRLRVVFCLTCLSLHDSGKTWPARGGSGRRTTLSGLLALLCLGGWTYKKI
ncbi:protein of unknown function [Desulfovibrio sp. 86]|nr:protein of unknown function [Desulfovibrio sp. 86]